MFYLIMSWTWFHKDFLWCLRSLFFCSEFIIRSRILNTFSILFILKRTWDWWSQFLVAKAFSLTGTKFSMSIIFKIIFGLISTWTRTLTNWFLKCASMIEFLTHWVLMRNFNFIMLWFISSRTRGNRSILCLFIINYSHWVLRSFNCSLFDIICSGT